MASDPNRGQGEASVPPNRPFRTSAGRLLFVAAVVLLLIGAVVLRLVNWSVAPDTP